MYPARDIYGLVYGITDAIYLVQLRKGLRAANDG